MPQNVLVSVLGEGEYLQKLIRAILEKEVVPQRNLFLSAKNAAACKAAEGYDEVRICEDELAAMIKSEIVLLTASKREMPTELAKISSSSQKRVAQVADGERRLSDVRMQVDEETDRLECLRQRADGVARDVAELEPIAADVRRFEGAGRAERGAILDSIAARCAGAARAARAAIEELGDRIWALMRPNPKKAQRTIGDVMREATEVARASEALSRGHVAPTNSRQRGQAR